MTKATINAPTRLLRIVTGRAVDHVRAGGYAVRFDRTGPDASAVMILETNAPACLLRSVLQTYGTGWATMQEEGTTAAP